MISQFENQERMIKGLIEKLKNFESIENERDRYSSKLGRLYDMGLIDKEGDPVDEEFDKSPQGEEEIRF